MQVLPLAAKRLKLDETSSVLCTPVLSKRKQEAPLPRPFDVPLNFPPNVEAALMKKSLFGKPRTKFITVIAQSIYRYKSYPTEEEYSHVVQQLYKKWPFLDDGRGLVSTCISLSKDRKSNMIFTCICFIPYRDTLL